MTQDRNVWSSSFGSLDPRTRCIRSGCKVDPNAGRQATGLKKKTLKKNNTDVAAKYTEGLSTRREAQARTKQ